MAHLFQEIAENMKMMALKLVYFTNSRIFYFLLSVIYSCSSESTATYYMDKTRIEDCGEEHVLAGATVYSHYQTQTEINYGHNIDCRLTFKARHDGWRLMLKVEELDIPDSSFGLCNDAVYIYDSQHYIIGKAFEEAGGIQGFCGNTPPKVLYSSGQYITVYFRTDKSGKTGKGFKLTITAFTEDYEKFGSCGNLFKCVNGKCIDPDLVCDSVDHCTDYSDEQQDGEAECATFDSPDNNGGNSDDTFMGRILSLGITASIAITVGSLVIVIVCSVSIVCCCCRYWKKRDQDPGGVGLGGGGGGGGVPGGGGTCTTTTTATHVTINNGGPPPLVPNGYPPTAYSQQGYYPMHPGNTGPQSVTYSPFTQQRESYSQGTGSMYSSHAPPSYHRSYTPTSSRSGRSLHSHSNEGSCKYNGESKTMPVNL